jgi:hypothetical protein
MIEYIHDVIVAHEIRRDEYVDERKGKQNDPNQIIQYQ